MPESVVPSEEYIRQVKEVLEHLYDYPYLDKHPLANQILAGNGTADSASQRLRKEIFAVIELLNPGPKLALRAPQSRLYNLLHLRYIEGMSVQETSVELSISLRQAHRDLRHAEESVAALLWSRWHPEPIPTRGETSEAAEAPLDRQSVVWEEIARLDYHPRPTDILSLLQRAITAVAPLAAQRSITFETHLPAGELILLAEPVMAQQVLINLLSYTIKQARPANITVTLDRFEQDTHLHIAYVEETRAELNPTILKMLDRLGWSLRMTGEGGDRIIQLVMPARGATILVIDDNEGLANLMDRYLSDQPYRVILASSGAEGLQLARENRPAAVILDIMMPGMDGWEILQRLRNHPETADIPVVICSVIPDPELAQSLGANWFLQKPVSREEVLGVLHRLGAF